MMRWSAGNRRGLPNRLWPLWAVWALVEVVDLLFRVTSGDSGVQLAVPLALAVSLTAGAVRGRRRYGQAPRRA